MSDVVVILLAVGVILNGVGLTIHAWQHYRQGPRVRLIQPPPVDVEPGSPLAEANKAFEQFGERIRDAFTKAPPP